MQSKNISLAFFTEDFCRCFLKKFSIIKRSKDFCAEKNKCNLSIKTNENNIICIIKNLKNNCNLRTVALPPLPKNSNSKVLQMIKIFKIRINDFSNIFPTKTNN